jgi:hypothetical protein
LPRFGMKKIILGVLLLMISLRSHGQLFSWLTGDVSEPAKELLTDRVIQIETSDAINNMYNFKFHAAERDFKWLLVKYPNHPIGHFLLGLNEWWQIVPDTYDKSHDNAIHRYMDKTIDLAGDMPSKSKEAAFFMAAAYAFKGRVYAERENWVKAAWAGKQALKFLEKSRGDENINPELVFGDGIYNYYSKWIHENYKSLKPLLTFFRKGDKNLGIKQLEHVSLNAFYTRMEARYFLVQIYAMEGNNTKALQVARQMHGLFPDNSFFHRYAARSSFSLNRLTEAEVYAKELLENIKAHKTGYGANDGRYAAYILGYVNQHYYRDKDAAKQYYEQCAAYAQTNDSEDSGFYLGAQLALGDFAAEEGNYDLAEEKYNLVISQKVKSSSAYEQAKERLKNLKQKRKVATPTRKKS